MYVANYMMKYFYTVIMATLYVLATSPLTTTDGTEQPSYSSSWCSQQTYSISFSYFISNCTVLTSYCTKVLITFQQSNNFIVKYVADTCRPRWIRYHSCCLCCYNILSHLVCIQLYSHTSSEIAIRSLQVIP